jgi:tetratricopeptide (TPR) repeat protein/DNA-binding winged helix-turn-helix (wHTH) protein
VSTAPDHGFESLGEAGGLPQVALYRFNGFELDPGRRCLRRYGVELHLRHKTFEVLQHLVQHPDRVVEREELIQQVWGGTAVSDDTLSQCIKEIRKALDDHSPERPFIKTVSGHGYRFMAPVEPVFPAPAGPAQAAPPATTLLLAPEYSRLTSSKRWVWLAAAGIVLVGALGLLLTRLAEEQKEAGGSSSQVPRVVAVMPFRNLNADPELRWLEDGLAGMLTSELMAFRRLHVVGRRQLDMVLDRMALRAPQALPVKDALEVGRRARADTVMLGSFVRLGSHLRIDVAIHQVGSGTLIASERLIAQPPEQILTELDLLGFKLAARMGLQRDSGASDFRLAEATTSNLEAYRYYSLALEQTRGFHNREAIELLKQAIALDPGFAMAHARIGYAYGISWNFREQARPYLERAFRMSNRLSERDRRSISAWYAIMLEDYSGAAQALHQLLRDYPDDLDARLVLGRLLHALGRYQAAIQVLSEGLILAPEIGDLYNAMISSYASLGRHDESIRMAERYVALEPDEANAYDSLGLAYHAAGRFQDALAQYEQARSRAPGFEVAIVHRANTLLQLGRYREALRGYQDYLAHAPSEWERARAFECIAWVHLRRGELELADRAAAAASRFLCSGNSVLVALERGDWERAERSSHCLLEPQSYNGRGVPLSLRVMHAALIRLALQRGTGAEAIALARKLLRAPPTFWHVRNYEDALAEVFMELGRWREAAREYQRALRMTPNDALATFNLAQAYERLGRPAVARPIYQQFLKLWSHADPELAEYQIARQRLQ